MLRVRVATALVLAIVVLGILFAAPAAVGAGFFGLVMLAGAAEWAAFAGLARPPQRVAYVLVVALLGALAWAFARTPLGRERLMLLATCFWVLCLLWLVLAPARVSHRAAAFAGLLVLVPAGVGIGRLLLAPVAGAAWLFFMLLLVWAADVGAYFAGRAFGRRKLAPRVSPNKTWEGFAGGVALAALVAAGGAFYFRVAAPGLLALALAVVLASVVGDLTESMMKRAAGLKDSGKLLPGHGGILDRIDSITASVPVFVLGLGWLGILG
jgi:phosphatidate cytidylyltransferase